MTGVSVTVAAVYYMFTLRINMKTQQLALKAQEQNLETRQAQLFMGIYDKFCSNEFRNAMNRFTSSVGRITTRLRDS